MRTLQIAIIASVIIFGVLASTDNAFSAIFTVSKDVSTEDTAPNDVAFNTDGTKMFVLGSVSNSVYEYNCSTGFDISTCVVDAGETFDASGQANTSEGMTFNTDGTKLFIVNFLTEDVFQYTCTAFDVSTCTYDTDLEKLDISNEEGRATDLTFNTDGTKLFVVGQNERAVHEYTCDAFDVSTCTYAGIGERLDVAPQGNSPTGIAFNTDGTKLFVLENSFDRVVEYACTVGFDVSTCTYSGLAEHFDTATQDIQSQDLTFNADGTKMYVIGAQFDSVYEYSVPIAFDVSSTSSPSTVPAETGGGGGNDRAKSAPTSGDDWNTHNLIVEGGITANGVTYDIEDNWHTDFELLKVKTGSPNKFVTKTWSQNGGLMLHEIAFGIPEVGSYDKAEAVIEVWYNHDKSIDKVVVVQKTKVINEQFLRVSTDQVKCREGADAMCYQTSFDVLFFEPLQHDIFAIKSVDMTRRSMSPTYLNDGIDVYGKTFSSMPTMTIPGPEKYEGLVEIKQTEKYSDLWMAQDGRIFQIFGESDSVRLLPQETARDIDNTKFSERSDSGFENYKNLINQRYILIFDASELEKQISESFAYEYPDIDSRTQFLIDSGLIDFVRK